MKKAEPRYVTASADYRNAPGGAAGMGYSQGSNFGGMSRPYFSLVDFEVTA